MIWICLNFFFMCFSLNVAFNKKFRPISWSTFWLNLFAVAVNLFAVCFNGYRFFMS